MSSLAAPDQEGRDRRLSWSGIKKFVKNTKRRSVQKLISTQGDVTITAEEQDFMDRKQRFKEYCQTVTKVRKHLTEYQAAVTKLSSSITVLADDEILLPVQGTQQLGVTKKRLDALGSANTTKGQTLIDLVENQSMLIKEKLTTLANIKKLVTERDNIKTDVESYSRRLDAARIKHDQKGTAKTQKDLEKLEIKLDRSKSNFQSANAEAIRRLDEIEASRGKFILNELQPIHSLSGKYFAALAESYGISVPKSASERMASGLSNAFNAGKDGAAKAAKSANNAIGTAKTAAALGAMSMATSSSGANPFLKKSSSNGGSSAPPKKQPSASGNALKPGTFVTATHDFIPEEDDELEFKKGDRLEVIEVVGPGWLMAKRSDGKTGMVPDTYVQ
eukprot:g14899.t1